MTRSRSTMNDLRPASQSVRASTDKTEDESASVFDELDRQRAQGRGSCCTLWSFVLLFGTLFLLGSAVLLWLWTGVRW